MSVLKWGKPLIEWAPSTNGEAGTGASWKAFPEIKKDTAKLNIAKGDKKEALEEGGGVVDVRYGTGKNTLVLTIYLQKGAERPIEHNDGIVPGEYAVRITPEDATMEGYLMDRCSVTAEEEWTAEEGGLITYTFEGLKPKAGKVVKPYTKGA